MVLNDVKSVSESHKMPRKRNVDPGVYQYPVEHGKRWGAVVSLPRDPRTGKRGQKRKQGFATKAEAQEWRRVEIIRRDQQLPDGRQPLNDYLDDWLDSLVELAPNTRRSYRNSLTPVRDALGHIAIGKITPALIDRFNTDRSHAGDTPQGIYQTHRIFKRAIRRAHTLGMIASDPFVRSRTPRNQAHVPVTWTIEQARQFIDVNGDDPVWGDLWHVLLETWLRVGEVTDLRWQDIAGNVIHVSHGVARNDDLVLQSGPTKTPRSRREIHISANLAQRLRKRRIRAIASDDDDLVFPPPLGTGFLHASAVSRALKRSCVKAGVPELTTHELRHTGGSLAYMAGIDIATISERMGHANSTITFNVYVRVNQDHHQAAAGKIGDLFATSSVLIQDTDRIRIADSDSA